MAVRLVALLVVSGVCLAADPGGPSVAAKPVAPADDAALSTDRLPTPAEFAALAKTDPVALLEASVRRYRAEVRGFRAKLHKRERLAGTLQPQEVLRVAVREEPYAVLMLWDEGARPGTLGGRAVGANVEGVLYAAGENEGQAKAWRPGALFPKVMSFGPTADQARDASRYALTEAGLGAAADRTRRVWAAARDRGRLRFEFLGTKPVPEVGGRVCHVVRRTCDPPEVDAFLAADPKPDAATRPADAVTTVTVMIDAETWLQVGSELRRADGELVGSYFFRNVERNPAFGPDQFKLAAFRK